MPAAGWTARVRIIRAAGVESQRRCIGRRAELFAATQYKMHYLGRRSLAPTCASAINQEYISRSRPTVTTRYWTTQLACADGPTSKH